MMSRSAFNFSRIISAIARFVLRSNFDNFFSTSLFRSQLAFLKKFNLIHLYRLFKVSQGKATKIILLIARLKFNLMNWNFLCTMILQNLCENCSVKRYQKPVYLANLFTTRMSMLSSFLKSVWGRICQISLFKFQFNRINSQNFKALNHSVNSWSGQLVG